MEDFILGSLENIGEFDFAILARFIAGSYIFLWALIALWVWFDSGERTRNVFLRILSVIVVFFGQLLGLFLYTILRSKATAEESYWGDLERRFLKYETSELGDCPNCGFNLMPGFNNCPNCAYVLKVKCPDCEVMLDKDWKHCPYCSRDMLDVQAEYSKSYQPKVVDTAVRSQVSTKVSAPERKENMKAFLKKINERKDALKAKKKAEEKIEKDGGHVVADVKTGESTAQEIKEDSSLKVDDTYAASDNISSVKPKLSKKDTTFLQFMGMLGSRILNTVVTPVKNKSTKTTSTAEPVTSDRNEGVLVNAEASSTMNPTASSTVNNAQKHHNKSYSKKKKKNRNKRRNR